MTDAAVDMKKSNNLLENLITKCENSSNALNDLVNTAEKHVKEKIFENGSLDTKLLEKEQFICHGFAWLKTYNIALREMLNWAKKLNENKKIHETEKLILQSSRFSMKEISFPACFLYPIIPKLSTNWTSITREKVLSGVIFMSIKNLFVFFAIPKIMNCGIFCRTYD